MLPVNEVYEVTLIAENKLVLLTRSDGFKKISCEQARVLNILKRLE